MSKEKIGIPPPVLWVIVFLIMVLPLMKGGNIEWARSAVISIGMINFLVFVIFFVERTTRKNVHLWLMVWGVITLFVFLQLVTWQIGPFPWIKSYVFDLNNENIPSRITSNPLETISYWAIFTVYWVIAWMISICSRRQIIMASICLFVGVAFQAGYSLFSFIGGQESILGIWEKYHYLNDVTGTFVNRNHLASFLALSLPMSLTILFLPKYAGGLDLPIIARFLIGVPIVGLSAMAVIGTHSRMGLLVFLASMTVFTTFRKFGKEFRGERGKNSLFLSMLILAGMIFSILWFGVDATVGRYAKISENARQDVWASLVMDIPFSVWLTGTGAGAFLDVFKTVSPARVADGSWYQAHNDWLEFMLDFGLVGSGLIIIAFIVWCLKSKPRYWSILHIGALSGILGIMLHSLLDFPLQKPGVAIVFWFCVGVLMNRNLIAEK